MGGFRALDLKQSAPLLIIVEVNEDQGFLGDRLAGFHGLPLASGLI